MLKRFIRYYKPHKLIFTLDMIAAFLVAAIGMGYPILTRYLLRDFIPNNDTKAILISSAGLLGIYVVRMFLRYFIQYYGHVMGVHMQEEMRREMFVKLEKLPISYYDEIQIGEVMSRMAHDLFDISELAHHGPENIFIAGFSVIASLTYLYILDWRIALVTTIIIPIVFSLTMFFRKKFRDAQMKSRKAIAKVNASVETSLSGVRVTKAFTNYDKELEKFDNENKVFVEARIDFLGAMGRYFAISQFTTDIFNVVVILVGGVLLSQGLISSELYPTFIVSVSMFISPLNQLINFMEQFQSGSTGFARFLEIIDLPEEEDKEGAIECNNVIGNIEFNHVDFKYQTSDYIFKDLNFSIKNGETVALVGPSGGGKTTICHLIPRFYDIANGEIKLDGVSIDNFTRESLRRNIGIVQQDVFLFGGTIRDNILYGKLNASEEEVLEAARKANIMEFIDSLPNGLNTEIGERGVKLSGGQKQRIAIARVFLKNPQILILDEATSALDNTTELLIQKSLDELMKGRTSIVVAHRLSTIRNANRIFVINKGKIEEQGSHDELMKLKGTYEFLYSLQFRTEDEIARRELDRTTLDKNN